MSNLFAIIHPEGWRFISIFAVISVVLAMISPNLGWVGVILTGWCAYFFRNPKRVVPQRQGLIVSPADGIVSLITTVVPLENLELGNDERIRVSIFLNVFDVHVNRIPIAGTIKKIVYHAGQFLNASFDKASDLNERNSLTIETADGVKVGVVQIAGLIARRIVCNVKADDEVQTGEIFGLIRFGSRVDVYLPPKVDPTVIVGQRMIAGETLIADLANPQTPMVGIRI